MSTEIKLTSDFWKNDETPLNQDNLNAMTNQILDNRDKIKVLESGKQDKIKGEVRDVLVFNENGDPVDSNTPIDSLLGKIPLIEDAESYDGHIPHITVAGELAPTGIDANDILIRPSDVPSSLDGKLLSFDFEGNVENSGISKTYVTNKADKVKPTASGNLASLNSNGNLVDSGINKDAIDELSTELGKKQDILEAGTGISIEGNKISATNSGGGGGPVDTHYSATSENAQSGKAVAEAIETVKLTAGEGIEIKSKKISLSQKDIDGVVYNFSEVTLEDINPHPHILNVDLEAINVDTYYDELFNQDSETVTETISYKGSNIELNKIPINLENLDNFKFGITPVEDMSIYLLEYAPNRGYTKIDLESNHTYLLNYTRDWYTSGGSSYRYSSFSYTLEDIIDEENIIVLEDKTSGGDMDAIYYIGTLFLSKVPLTNVTLALITEREYEPDYSEAYITIYDDINDTDIVYNTLSEKNNKLTSLEGSQQTIYVTPADKFKIKKLTYEKNINKALNITPYNDPKKQLALTNDLVGEATIDNGEIFNTYKDKTYSFSQYPQYNAKVLNSSSANRENGRAYKNKSISEKTTTSGSSNISGCKAFKIIGHSDDVRGLNGGAGHYYIEKNSESIKLVEDYYDEDVNKTKLYGCYSTWLFTNTGGNNRAEMVESTITISEDGDRYKINVSNFTNLESVNSNFADNVSYIRFYEKYEQSVGNNQTRFIPMPLVELGDTSIEGWSYAGGLNNKAVGLGSFVIGNENIADGAYSFVAGRQNIGGFTSFVAGRWNKVGQYGAAFGQLNNVIGNNGFASGGQNTVEGINGVAFGNKNKVIGSNSSVFGCFNEPSKILFDKSEDDVFNTDNIVIHSGAINNTITYAQDKKSIIFKGNNTSNTIGLKNSGGLIKLSSNNDYRIVCHYGVSNNQYYKPSITYFEVFLGTGDINQSGKIPIDNLTKKIDTNLQTVTIDFNSGVVNTSKCYLYLRINSSNLVTNPVKLDSIEVHKCILSSVGNGSSDNNRSNAFEVYKDGHAEVQTMGNTDNSVVTKKYVGDNYATKSHHHAGKYSKVSVMTGSGYNNEANNTGINIYIGNDKPSKTNIPIGSLWIKPVE